MYKIRITPFLLVLMFFGLSCAGEKEKSPVVAAYDAATEKVLEAESSEQLLEISYDLYLELQAMGKSTDAPDAVLSRSKFQKTVKEKEVEFYSKAKNKK